MDVYDAIMKAADQIEKYPSSFWFSEPRVPDTCETPGCAIGWIAHFAGTKARNYHDASRELFGLDPHEIYWRMTVLETGKEEGRWETGSWPANAGICAKAMRAYVEKYHAPRPALDPGFVKLRGDLNELAAVQLIRGELSERECRLEGK